MFFEEIALLTQHLSQASEKVQRFNARIIILAGSRERSSSSFHQFSKTSFVIDVDLVQQHHLRGSIWKFRHSWWFKENKQLCTDCDYVQLGWQIVQEADKAFCELCLLFCAMTSAPAHDRYVEDEVSGCNISRVRFNKAKDSRSWNHAVKLLGCCPPLHFPEELLFLFPLGKQIHLKSWMLSIFPSFGVTLSNVNPL